MSALKAIGFNAPILPSGVGDSFAAKQPEKESLDRAADPARWRLILLREVGSTRASSQRTKVNARWRAAHLALTASQWGNCADRGRSGVASRMVVQ
jgi:hypothetical protein